MKIFMAILCLLLLFGGNATAEDQITVTKVKGYPAVGDTSDTSDIVIATFTGKDFEELRPDAEAVAKWMGDEDRWTDLPPDSSYISVSLSLGGRIFIINSWYPLLQEEGRIDLKKNREGAEFEKYKDLYALLDKISEKTKDLQQGGPGYSSQGAGSPDP